MSRSRKQIGKSLNERGGEVLVEEALAREVVSSMKSKIGDRRLEFSSNGPLPPVALDRRLVKLAVKQLLDNALKYSPSESSLAIQVFCSNGTVGLEITDHGKGISAQEQTRIFQRFYRSPSVQDQIPGFGLGLSIAHRIMEAHRGDLTVRSFPGETTFRMTLPVEPLVGHGGSIRERDVECWSNPRH